MKNKKLPEAREMRKEYDFSEGVRGKYVERLLKGTNLVRIPPDVLEVFPDSESIKRALRSLAEIVREQRRANGTSRGSGR